MKNLKIILIISFIIALSFAAFPEIAIADDFAIGDLDPPDEYDQLLEKYRDMAEIALGFRELYQEAEADVIKLESRVERLLLQMDRQQDLIELQDELIDDLLTQGSDNFFIIAGISYLPVRNERQVFVGLQYQIPVPFF